MINKIIIALSTFTLIHSYDTYKDFLNKQYNEKNDVYKYEDEEVILYRSRIYSNHILGKKKSDKSLIAFMPTSKDSVRIIEKDGHKYRFKEESPTELSTTFDVDTSAFERYIETSFNDNQHIFETGERKLNSIDDYSVAEK